MVKLFQCAVGPSEEATLDSGSRVEHKTKGRVDATAATVAMAYGGRRNPREQARAWPQKAKVVLPEKRERGNEDELDGWKGSGKEDWV